MKTTNIKTLAAALAAIISVGVLTSCSANTAQTNPEPSETTITTTSQTTPETTEKPQTTSAKETTTPSSTKTETQTEKTAAPTSTAPATTATSTTKPATASTTKPAPASTAPASTTAPAPEWTESAVSGTRYVNTAGIYSRNKAVLGAPTVKQYNLNDAVSVTAVTNTGYYKLSDGNFIHADYLGKDKVVVQTTKPNTSKPSTTAKPSTTTPSTTEKPSITKPSTSTTAKPNSWREGETEEHYNAALKVAKKIADEVRAEVGKEKSLKQIAFATDKVAEYYDKCSYDDTKVVNWSAWGVFIGKEASCAGATKALGMVLEQLGFEWEHMYEHSKGHQFCKVVNFSYNEEIPSLISEIKIDFDENINDWVYIEGGEVLETGMLKGNLPIYADADGDITGFTLGIGQGLGFEGRFGYSKEDKSFGVSFADTMNDDGTLEKDGFIEWKHKDLSQYLS